MSTIKSIFIRFIHKDDRFCGNNDGKVTDAGRWLDVSKFRCNIMCYVHFIGVKTIKKNNNIS